MSASAPGAAFFDVDGTLVESNIVHYYHFLARRGRSWPGRLFWYLGFLPELALYPLVDRMSRAAFNRLFYRRYRGMDVHQTRQGALELLRAFIVPRLFPGALREVEFHRQQGRPLVFITGSLDFIVEPLGQRLGADACLCVRLRQVEDRFTGELESPPLSDQEKARALRAYAAEHQLDLNSSFAYGNDPADIPMLRQVGHPVAVNPGGALERMARRQGWEIRRWSLDT